MPNPGVPKTRKAPLLCGALLALAPLLVFYPGLSGGFIFDDSHAIVLNTSVHMTELTLASLRAAWGGFIPSQSGRSLVMLSFALDHLAWGGNAYGYKLSNLLLHSLNTLLIFLLARVVLRLGSNQPDGPDEGRALFWPLIIALVWALHPLQASTVLYVVQRMEMMALTFTVIALLAYLRARLDQIAGRGLGIRWLLVAALSTGLGFLCKETALLVPLFALCLELTLLGFRAARTLHERLLRWIYLLGILAAALVYFVIVWPHYTEPLTYATRDFTWDERVLTQLRVLPMYLGQIVWPDPQSHVFFYDNFPKSTGLLTPPTTLFGGLFLAALLGTALAVRRRLPLVSLGILLFFAAHFLTSNIVSLELVFEHRNHFAIFGIALAGVSLLRAAGGRLHVLPLAPMAVAVVVGLAAITAISAATWGQPLAHAMALKHNNPGSERAGYRLGDMYLRLSEYNADSPFFDFARNEFKTLVNADGNSPMPEQALIVMHARAGEPVDPAWWDSLIAKVESGPTGPQQLHAVRRLLHVYNHGHPIDPDRLMDAGITLLNLPRVHPVAHFNFAIHALEALEDERLARILIVNASRIAQDLYWDRQMINDLDRRGHTDFARRMAEELVADRARLEQNEAN